ncbi:MAG: type I-E CRISPR-associated protein Cas7/Cse4/CasC, partial [Nitrospira sp.]|nr:type I-E CRISPR-associated protein Cas7/Cse4/CasC [Nitrospira sp.]
MKTLIEIHALQNFAPSNLNRDDTGSPKDALFGGTRRARVSSQCQKKTVRGYFDEKKNLGFFSPDELAVRTKRVYQAIADILKGRHGRDESLAKAEIALSYVKLNADKDGKTQYLLFLGQREIAALAEVIHESWDLIVSEEKEGNEKTKGKKSKKTTAGQAPKEIQDRIASIFNGGKAVDVALFGRMLADMPEKNQNAACQVAHAISTHAVEREFDFYTAVDQLKPEDTAGADMMGTVEFNSACFYRYALIDWEKLRENLQDDVTLAEKGLKAFLEGFIIAEPTGKQNSFAAHNPPEFVAISVRYKAAPRNLANAFEIPIRVKRDESITKESASKLIEKAKVLASAFDGKEAKGQTHVLNLVKADMNGIETKVDSLENLLT